MITVLTVYNKRDFLERVLLASLRKQTVPFELIAVDNTNGKYKSAAAAFNAEARQAKGDYVLFAHQDVDFGDDTEWLHKVEKYMATLESPGIVGFAGFDFSGHFLGYLSSCGQDLGKKESGAVEVQTLDGYLFIIPRKILDRFPFDEAIFDGWHLYADDYCLTTQRHGLKTYVIPFFTYHRSLSINNAGIIKYKRRFLFKYGGRTFTSVGVINAKFLIKSFIQQLIEPAYTRLFPDWIQLLKREVGGFDSILDLGCGYNSPIQHLHIPRKVGVEENGRYLEESKKKAVHQEYIQENLLEVVIPPNSFDIVFVSQEMGRLDTKERESLLNKMEIWAKKKTVAVTRNESGVLEDFKRRGYRVYGIDGFKFLRNTAGNLKHRPWYLFVFLSDLSQKVAYFFPSLASRLFAVKDVSV